MATSNVTKVRTDATDPLDRSQAFRPVTLTSTANNAWSETFDVSNPTAVIVIETLEAGMMLNEASRTWTYANLNGTITGGAASGSGAIRHTLTMPAGSRGRYTVNHVMNAPTALVGSSGQTIVKAQPSMIVRKTETTVNAVGVSPLTTQEYPGRSVNLGPGLPRYAFNVQDADAALRNLVSNASDADMVRMNAWLAEGNDLWDLIGRTTTDPSTRWSGQATAATVYEGTVLVAKTAGTITAATVTFDSAVTGQASNYFTLNLRNRGTAGVGTAVPASLAFSSAGVTAAAFIERALTLSTTPSDLVVNPGDVITLEKAVTGSGLACPPATVKVTIS